MVKALIFDLGGVYFADGTTLAIKNISKKYNVRPDLVEQFLRTGSELGALYRRGEITMEEFWNRAKRLANIKADNNDLNEMWIKSYVPIKGTVEIVKRLKRKGIKLYFLSDNAKERVEYLQRKYNFLKDFVDGIFST